MRRIAFVGGCDLDDPTKIIGRLTPSSAPKASNGEGYLPNGVYGPGSLLRRGHLLLPYAASDRNTAFASVPLDSLIAALREGPVPE